MDVLGVTMNEQERALDLALAECEQENRLLRARNERLNKEVEVLRDAVQNMANRVQELEKKHVAIPNT